MKRDTPKTTEKDHEQSGLLPLENRQPKKAPIHTHLTIPFGSIKGQTYYDERRDLTN